MKISVITAVLISLPADDLLIKTELTGAFVFYFTVVFQDGGGLKSFCWGVLDMKNRLILLEFVILSIWPTLGQKLEPIV